MNIHGPLRPGVYCQRQAQLILGRVLVPQFRRTWLRSQSHSATSHHPGADVKDIRNIGIIAHVDAGKTTTTERMLFCSGFTHRQGKVDEGSTVTDFLELERQKGITIQSAAVTFNWPLSGTRELNTHPRTINLIDTPGHQDFRFEVDRCLPVLDGAICIIDAVEGVEAHTERVWASAQSHQIPRILFINKLDRLGASFRKSVLDIATRLRCLPVVFQIPWYEGEQLVGVLDVVDRIGYRWTLGEGGSPLSVISTIEDPTLIEEMERARENIVSVLADHDEEVLETFAESPSEVASDLIKRAMRRVIRTGDAAVVPVFAGASLRSIGVEPLLDAVVDYLPSPDERPDLEVQSGHEKIKLSELVKQTADKSGRPRLSSVASVFKVASHPKEGLLSYVRVYSGSLHRHSSPWNTHLLHSERPLALVQVSANKTHNLDELKTGQIGALKGLKGARTGDTLLTTASNKGVLESLQRIQIRPPDIPPPVAFLAIDPFGPVAANELQTALEEASREDPSLRWLRDEKTDQFLLQGMGKLHLDIAVHNLKSKLVKVNALFGEVEVDYKECIAEATGWHRAVLDKPIVGKTGKVACSAMLEPLELRDASVPLPETAIERGGNVFDVRLAGLSSEDSHIAPEVREAQLQIVNGAIAALARGPRRGSQVHGCLVTIEVHEEDTKTPSGGHYSGAARQAVKDAIQAAHERHAVGVLEPIMSVRITCPESAAGVVQHDISSAAGGIIQEVKDMSSSEATDNGAIDVSQVYTPPDPYDAVTSQRVKSTTRRVEITAKVPFKEMIDYDTSLRSKTGGRHTMTMSFDSLGRVTGFREKNL